MKIEKGFNPSCSEFCIYVNTDNKKFKEIEDNVRLFLDYYTGSYDADKDEVFDKHGIPVKIKNIFKKLKLDPDEKEGIMIELADVCDGIGYSDHNIFGRGTIKIEGNTGDQGDFLNRILEIMGCETSWN